MAEKQQCVTTINSRVQGLVKTPILTEIRHRNRIHENFYLPKRRFLAVYHARPHPIPYTRDTLCPRIYCTLKNSEFLENQSDVSSQTKSVHTSPKRARKRATYGTRSERDLGTRYLRACASSQHAQHDAPLQNGSRAYKSSEGHESRNIAIS